QALGYQRDGTFLAQLTRAHGNRPVHLRTIPVLLALLNTGIARVTAYVAFLAVQQLIYLGDIGCIGRRAHYAVNQPAVGIHTNVRLHAEKPLISFPGLMHLGITLTILILGRTRRMDDGRVDDGAMTQHQSVLTQVAVDDLEQRRGHAVALKETTKIEDSGFVRNSVQVQTGKLTQNGCFVERLLHGWIAVAEPVLHQMHTQHGFQRIGWTSTFAPGVMRFDQRQQGRPGHHLIHLDQEAFAAGLFAFTSILGIGEAHLFHATISDLGKTRAILTLQKVFFRLSLSTTKPRRRTANTTYLYETAIYKNVQQRFDVKTP